MTKISRIELLKLAERSHLKLHDHEIDPLIFELEQMLSYAQRVAQVVGSESRVASGRVNVVREDVVIVSDAQAVLAQAPERAGNYFVVPIILENN